MEQLTKLYPGFDHLLEIVQHQEDLFITQRALQTHQRRLSCGFADADLARVRHNTPALCVVSLNGAIPRKMYDRRLVRLAIEPANPKTMEPVVPGRETFARAYEVTTEESVRSR